MLTHYSCPKIMEWLGQQNSWYEGSEVNIPSTNNAPKTISRFIKDKDTIRECFSLLSYTVVVFSMANRMKSHTCQCKKRKLYLFQKIIKQCIIYPLQKKLDLQMKKQNFMKILDLLYSIHKSLYISAYDTYIYLTILTNREWQRALVYHFLKSMLISM